MDFRLVRRCACDRHCGYIPSRIGSGLCRSGYHIHSQRMCRIPTGHCIRSLEKLASRTLHVSSLRQMARTFHLEFHRNYRKNLQIEEKTGSIMPPGLLMRYNIEIFVHRRSAQSTNPCQLRYVHCSRYQSRIVLVENRWNIILSCLRSAQLFALGLTML